MRGPMLMKFYCVPDIFFIPKKTTRKESSADTDTALLSYNAKNGAIMHAQLFCERDDALTRIVYARLENSEFSILETTIVPVSNNR